MTTGCPNQTKRLSLRLPDCDISSVGRFGLPGEENQVKRRMIVAVARASFFSVVLFAAWSDAGSPSALAATVADVPLLTAAGLGKGTVELGGPWQFHLGDNPDWASRSLD